MTPDSPGVRDMLIVILLTLGALSLAFARVEAGTRAAGRWGAGVLLLGLGYALLQWHGRVPEAVSVGGEIIMLVAVAITHGAILRFARDSRTRTDALCWAIVCVAGLLIAWFAFGAPSARARIVVFSAAIAGIAALASIATLGQPAARPAPRMLFAALAWCVVALFAARAVATLTAGEQSEEYFRHDTLQPYAALVAAVLAMSLTVALMWVEVSVLNARLTALATHDGLTGLLNHGAVLNACQRELDRAARYGQPVSVAMLDIDHFKDINDTHGHQTGDAVLRHLSSQLTADSRRQDVCGRYGGEEFLILMPQTGLDAALATMDRLRRNIEARPCGEGRAAIPITVSIGVAELDPVMSDLNALVDAADQAMYQAKQAGRNRVVGAPAPSARAGAAAPTSLEEKT